MTADDPRQCDPVRMQDLLAAAGADPARGVAELDRALGEFPDDARLHFLKGSLLIGLGRHVGAHAALARAVELAPDFAIARFQLGFFELTSGELAAARATWTPLYGFPDDHYLRHFVAGLEALVADQFDECIARLRAGQQANSENPVLNRDMDLIIARCDELVRGMLAADDGCQDVSATSLLLRSTGGTSRRRLN